MTFWHSFISTVKIYIKKYSVSESTNKHNSRENNVCNKKLYEKTQQSVNLLRPLQKKM